MPLTLARRGCEVMTIHAQSPGASAALRPEPLTVFERQDPRAADALRIEGALAYAAAVAGGRKAVANRLGRSRETVDATARGEPSSVVYRFDLALLAVENPWPLVEHVETVSVRRQLDWPIEKLAARLREIVAELEPVADARQKAAALCWVGEPGTGTRDTLARALAEENHLQREALAIIGRLNELRA